MISRLLRRSLVAAALLAASATQTADADAFCGFYVGGAGAKLFNDATVVVLVRDGTRTVLSMQNAYKGPPEKFAMVVPVPVVLQEENVKTLDKKLFDHIDQLAAPRLVEYWEQDPCAPQVEYSARGIAAPAPMAAAAERKASAADLGVTIEAQFAVGEYQIVILSAKDSSGLDTWLHQEKYTIPEGAEPYFRPYVASGSKFFVAKVDTQKVKMEDGLAVLSPLRFHYDSDEFRLPVRLGLINSSGTQDLIVHILAKSRYEVANYPNVTIPTNLDVSEAASEQFGQFYTTLFDRTVTKNPKAVVTEYAWQPTSCDPCPGPALDMSELATFGFDVLPSMQGDVPPSPVVAPSPGGGSKPTAAPPMPRRRFNPWMGSSFVLTRLHARYTKDSLGEDLVFKEAKPIVGGREVRGEGGKLEESAQESGFNNFQARYAVRHPWTGPIDCKNPQRGIWGGKPGGGGGAPTPKAAQKLGFVQRTSADLSTFVKQDIPEIGFVKGAAAATPPAPAADGTSTPAAAAKRGCLGCAVTEREVGASGAGLAALAALVLAGRRRGRRG